MPNEIIPYTYSNSISQKHTTLEGELQNLEEELRWFRETSKRALTESWNEVERLQCQCAEHIKVEVQLKAELMRSQEELENARANCFTEAGNAQSPLRQDTLLSSNKDTFLDQSVNSQLSTHFREMEELNHQLVEENTQGKDENNSLFEEFNHRLVQENKQRTDENDSLSSSNKGLSFPRRIWPWSNKYLEDTEKSCSEEEMCEHVSLEQKNLPRPNRGIPFIQSTLSLLSGFNSEVQEVNPKIQVANSIEQGAPVCSTNDTSHLSKCSLSSEISCDAATTTTQKRRFSGISMYVSNETTKSTPSHLNHNTKPKDLILNTSPREKILEQKLCEYLGFMQNMQAEMKCSTETYRIREKRLASTYRVREERLQKIIEFLRKEVEKPKPRRSGWRRYRNIGREFRDIAATQLNSSRMREVIDNRLKILDSNRGGDTGDSNAYKSNIKWNALLGAFSQQCYQTKLSAECIISKIKKNKRDSG